MEENRFFKFVWRFNGLILMVTGIMAIVLLAFIGYKVVMDVIGEKSVYNVVNIQNETVIKEEWQLGYPVKIRGTSYFMCALTSGQSYAKSYYNKSSSSARNYLFINGQNNEMYWLFKTNEYLLVAVHQLPDNRQELDEEKSKAILYQVVKKDTNNDQRLTDQDLQTIAISRPDGQAYEEILDGVELFIGQQTTPKNKLLIIFQKKGVKYSVVIDLVEFTISDKTAVPQLTS